LEETEEERGRGDASRGSAWPRAGRSRAATGERDAAKEMSEKEGVERVMSEKKELADEGASTERGRTVGESFLEDCLVVEEIVPLRFIADIVGKCLRRPFEQIPN